MILSHLKPNNNNKCPLCSSPLLKKDLLLMCENKAYKKCTYFSYSDIYCLFDVGKYNITLFYKSDRLIIFRDSKQTMNLPQSDFVDFNWASSDSETKLDLLFFYN